MNDEKKVWFFECRCGRRFVAHVPARATCTRHDKPVAIDAEQLHYKEAMQRLRGRGEKPKTKKRERARKPEQLTLGF